MKQNRIHLAKAGIGKNAKQTFCGISIHKELPIAIKGEVFFEHDNKPIQFLDICKNCGSLFAKKPINKVYLNSVLENEKILKYEKQLPKTLRSMNYYRSKHKLNWNSKTSTIEKKLEMKHDPIPGTKFSEFKDIVKSIDSNELQKKFNPSDYPSDDTPIELTEVVPTINPIVMGEKTDKGKLRDMRKSGLLPFIKKTDKSIDRIQMGTLAIVRGFGNTWKVLEEFTSIGNCNGSAVKELTGWINLDLARKVFNQAIINREMSE